MGSKNRIAKYILPIILKDRRPNQWYVEPFVGGCNLIDKLDGLRYGNDFCSYLIAMWQALQDGWIPPQKFSEEEYKHIKNNKETYEKHLVGYVGYNLSYGAKWFGGYRRDKAGVRDYALEAYNNVMKQVPKIKDVLFYNKSYDDLILPPNSITYCDPPYENTTKYKTDFNHEAFWEWAKNCAKEGHTIYISEYNAPKDFICIWEKEIASSLTKDTGSKKGIERLFTI